MAEKYPRLYKNLELSDAYVSEAGFWINNNWE